MFTGLVEETGKTLCLELQGDSHCLLSIEAPHLAAISKIGESIAVNGCCLTLVKLTGARMDFQLLQETLRCTNLGNLQVGSPVNCEPSLAAQGRLGGHFVQGHIDTTATVLSANYSRKEDGRLEIEIPSGFAHYLIPKGSISVNGVSLTVAELKKNSFVLWIIPHTLEKTNLGTLKTGSTVNLEFDLLAKYIERLVKKERSEGGPKLEEERGGGRDRTAV